jgi:NTP pyrophosphatase (non-canonical NTP hydrolase)
MLDYSPQINQYLLKNADPQLQQLIKQMTPQQINQAVSSSPQIQELLTNQVVDATPKPNTQRFLDKLQEECSEVIQAVSKIRRFGPHNSHPDRKTSNKQELIGELEDLLALVAVLEGQQYFDLTKSREAIKAKAEALLR